MIAKLNAEIEEIVMREDELREAIWKHHLAKTSAGGGRRMSVRGTGFRTLARMWGGSINRFGQLQFAIKVQCG